MPCHGVTQSVPTFCFQSSLCSWWQPNSASSKQPWSHGGNPIYSTSSKQPWPLNKWMDDHTPCPHDHMETNVQSWWVLNAFLMRQGSSPCFWHINNKFQFILLTYMGNNVNSWSWAISCSISSSIMVTLKTRGYLL